MKYLDIVVALVLIVFMVAMFDAIPSQAETRNNIYNYLINK